MKRVIAAIVSAAMIFAVLPGCSGHVTTVAGNRTVIGGSSTGVSDTTGTTMDTGSTTTITTAIVVITDKKGKAVTKADGTPETTVVTTLTTKIVKVTTPGGKAVTQKEGKAVTTVVTTPTVTTKATAGGTTAAAAKATTAATIKHTTTTTKRTTTTAKKTTTTTKKATTTTADDGNPWTYPYDLNAIYADCKTKVQIYGVTWDDSLRPDGIDVSWDNPESTYYFTHHPEDPTLKKYVFGDIDYYCNGVDTPKPKYLRVWFEPYSKYPGDYHIYYLEIYA